MLAHSLAMWDDFRTKQEWLVVQLPPSTLVPPPPPSIRY